MKKTPSNPRKRTPPETETQVLVQSKRRCALCYGLLGDFEVKKGQIAHIDQDHSNAALENLVFLCMNHHDEYDSKTSQSKGIRQDELVRYHEELKAFIAQLPPAEWGARVDTKKRASQNHSKIVVFELYTKRLEMYNHARLFILEIVRNASIELPAIFKFAADTDESLFLFDKDIDDYFHNLYKQAVHYRYLNNKIKNRPNSPDWSELIDEESTLLLWFSDQVSILRDKVKAYMVW